MATEIRAPRARSIASIDAAASWPSRGRPHRADRRHPSIRSRAALSATRSTITCAIASTIATPAPSARKVNGRWQRLEWDTPRPVAAKLTRAKEPAHAVRAHTKGNGSFAASRSWASASSTSTVASRKRSGGSAAARPTTGRRSPSARARSTTAGSRRDTRLYLLWGRNPAVTQHPHDAGPQGARSARRARHRESIPR